MIVRDLVLKLRTLRPEESHCGFRKAMRIYTVEMEPPFGYAQGPTLKLRPSLRSGCETFTGVFGLGVFLPVFQKHIKSGNTFAVADFAGI